MPADIARLNVLIELFSECAEAADLETLLHVAALRLRWVLDFDHCTFALERPEGRVSWVGTLADDALRRVMPADVPSSATLLVEKVLVTGAPAGDPPGAICVPLQVAGRTTGAICFSTKTGAYTYRDLRLGHHAGQYLGSLISRMDLEEETRRFSKRKDDLLALLSHELRNPLAPIVAAVQLLRLERAAEPSKVLDIVERQTQHLVHLVDDLLDVARLTRGKLVLTRAPVELLEVVEMAREMVASLLEKRGHTLTIDVAGQGLVVDADKSRLAQVVSNLLNNAALYTREGGHIGVAACRDGDTVAVTVSDDGIGIATDALSNVFDLFVQGESASGVRQGLGLGLVVVKQLTELHGGSVTVASEGSGHGTKFTLRLPILAAGSIAPGVSASSFLVPQAGSPRRVLLVDDNEDALDLLSTLIETSGHEVVIAHDGMEALAVFERFRPSVAVIDISMPIMDGCEVAARIRAQTVGERHPYLVALTGYGQTLDRERSRAAGFDEHLVKPVVLENLLRAIARGSPDAPMG